MSIKTFTSRELALVAVRFGASPADLAILADGHQLTYQAWYKREAPTSSAEDIERAIARIRTPLSSQDAIEACEVYPLLTYNLSIPERDLTREEPWVGALRRVSKAVDATFERERLAKLAEERWARCVATIVANEARLKSCPTPHAFRLMTMEERCAEGNHHTPDHPVLVCDLCRGWKPGPRKIDRPTVDTV